MQALLRAAGRPLAAPSANASGSISPTRAEHVLKSLGGRIPLIVDAGPTERGLESTIVAATGGPLRLLRPGPIAVDGGDGQRRPRSRRPASLPAIMRRRSRCGSTRRSGRADEFLIGFGAARGRREPQPVRRPGRGRRAPVRPASPGRRFAQAAHRGRARSRTTASAPRSTTGCAGRRAALGRRAGAFQPAPGSSCAISAAWAGSPRCNRGSAALRRTNNPGGNPRPDTIRPWARSW